MAHRAKQISKTVLRRLGTLLYACICVSMLSGCTYLWRDPPETAGRMTPPKAADSRPGMAEDGTATEMNGAMGMKVEPLFAEKIYSKSKRLDRLENAVQTLNDDFWATHDGTNTELDILRDEVSTLKEEITTLREEQEAMMAQPESLHPKNTLPDDAAMAQDNAAGGPQSLSASSTSDNAAPAAIQRETKRPSPPPAAGDKFTVRNIRFGEHANKTRIVLDIDGKPDYAISLDNVEKILLIELPGGAWTTTAEGTPKSPLISSYSAQGMGQGNAGNMLVISLKHVTEIVARDLLPPSSGSGYRLVIDLYSRPVHS